MRPISMDTAGDGLVFMYYAFHPVAFDTSLPMTTIRISATAIKTIQNALDCRSAPEGATGAGAADRPI